jgi:hypothetical protein
MHPQINCSAFSILPAEVRNAIFIYAVTLHLHYKTCCENRLWATTRLITSGKIKREKRARGKRKKGKKVRMKVVDITNHSGSAVHDKAYVKE